MSLKEKFQDIIRRIFVKKLPDKIETEDVIENDSIDSCDGYTQAESSLADSLREANESYGKRFLALAENYQLAEDGVDIETMDSDEILRIVLGAVLERKGATRPLIDRTIYSRERIRMEEPIMWPMVYGKYNDPQVILPETRDGDYRRFDNIEDIMKLKEKLMKSIYVSKDGQKFTVFSYERENYHGEECTVLYSNSYGVADGIETFEVDKSFDPLTTSKDGIHYSMSLRRKNGRDVSVIEEKKGYLDDNDNYYYKSKLDEEGGKLHVLVGRPTSNGEESLAEFDEPYSGRICSFENSVAAAFISKGLTTNDENGKKILGELLSSKPDEVVGEIR